MLLQKHTIIQRWDFQTDHAMSIKEFKKFVDLESGGQYRNNKVLHTKLDHHARYHINMKKFHNEGLQWKGTDVVERLSQRSPSRELAKEEAEEVRKELPRLPTPPPPPHRTRVKEGAEDDKTKEQEKKDWDHGWGNWQDQDEQEERPWLQHGRSRSPPKTPGYDTVRKPGRNQVAIYVFRPWGAKPW